MPEVLQDRPPFVKFEVRQEEDRDASTERGHYVARDVDFAIITPAGSKDRVERKVKDWFAMLESEVRQQRFPPEWLSQLKEGYKVWKEGGEVPLNGRPLMDWPALSPAQLENLKWANVRTIEDLAAANEETIANIGMGGRDLKLRAQKYLEALEADPLKLSAQVTALMAKVENLAMDNKKLADELAAAKASNAAIAAGAAKTK